MDIKSLLFLDIETIPEYPKLKDAPSRISETWTSKHMKSDKFIEKYGDPKADSSVVEKSYQNEAALLPEYGKIVCISVGMFTEVDEGGTNILRFKLKSYYGKNEKDILQKIQAVLDHSTMQKFQICAHNGKGFDFPFMANRYIINNVPMPQKLQVWNKKPWELTQFVDTMELWKFGKFRGTS